MRIAQPHEVDEFYQKNLSLLSPWLQDTLAKLDPREIWDKVKISYNPQGYPVAYYNDGATCVQLTSQQPVEEAEQWCETIDYPGAGAVFFYGSGFGYPLFELFKRKQPHTFVVLFEEDLHIFAAMLHYFDMEPILRSNKLGILVGNPKSFAPAFDALFFSMVFVYSTSPVLAYTPMARRKFREEYQEINQFVYSQLGLYVFYMGNDHLDNLIGFHNMVANVREIIKNPSIDCLKSKYKNYPAFIIANGPSLDKNIHHLKTIGNKGLVICAESAIIPLLKKGIKPDILTIIERTKYTYTYHFEDVEYPKDMALLSLALVDKQVYPAFPGEIIPIFRKGEAINKWINSHLGDGSALNAGANVTHLALELAAHLGANPIVLVGQDYAYGPTGDTHSKDAVYSQDKGKRAREKLKDKMVVYVEGNDGTQIPSNQLWTDFKHGLEGKIATHRDRTVYNATEGGAKIKGTQITTLAETIQNYCNRSLPSKVHHLVAQQRRQVDLASKTEGLKQFMESVEEYQGKFRILSQNAVQKKMLCREMLALAQLEDNENRERLERAYHDNIQAYQDYIRDDLCRAFCQQVIFAYYYLMNRLGLIDTQEKTLEIFQIQHDFFHHLGVVCQSLSVHFEDALDFLREVGDEYGN